MRLAFFNASLRSSQESADINTALSALKQCIRSHKSGKKAPFRAHLLTRILRDCFVDPEHFTVIIATVSPTTIDTIHTLNTLNHVALMQTTGESTRLITKTGSGAVEGYLNGVISAVTVEVPIVADASLNKPVAEWTADEVRSWVAAANGGKFSHIVLPPSLTGRGLLRLNETNLSKLFDASQEESTVTARGAGEGSTWVISANSGSEGRASGSGSSAVDIGRELFQALRIEQKHVEKKLLASSLKAGGSGIYGGR